MATPLDQWQFLDVDKRRYGNENERRQRIRLNALCSLYYFGKYILNRKDLNITFHKPLCDEMQKLQFKDLFRIARGHLKSTIASEMLPMWRTLRVVPADIEYLLNLLDANGQRLYGDNFIKYLLAVHKPDSTWILGSERKELSVDLLKRIKLHYENNQSFRWVFNDMLPYACFPYAGRAKTTWGMHQLTVQRDDLTISEPTFQAQGMNQSLQSKHVSGGVIEDDVTGRRCLKSATMNQDVIRNHTLLAGLFYDEDKDHAGNQLVVANDWHKADLNHHIEENEKWFTIHTSGCLYCDICGSGTLIDLSTFKTFDTTGEMLCINGHPTRPVFPEKYTLKKIYQEWLGMKSNGLEIDFSSQYLNQPGSSSDAIFPSGWLRYYTFLDRSGKPTDIGTLDGYVQFTNEIGEVRRKRIADMNRYMVMDPSYGSTSLHACRAALPVTVVDDEGHVFLLEDWAQACNVEVVYEAANILSAKWRIDLVYVEAAGAGRVIGEGLNIRNELKHINLRAYPIKPEGEFRGFVQASQTPINSQKEARIYGLQPWFETKFWCRRDQMRFLKEYKNFSIPVTLGTHVDLLDALSYGPQLWETPMSWQDMQALETHRQMYLLEAERGLVYR